jgi:Zn-dependent peptidase ImmA (M78 family)
MTELPSSTDIEKISYDILKGSKAWGVFPTPVDKIVNYSELIINNQVDISNVHESYLHKATNALFKAISKVRGLLDRRKKTIYLDLSQLPTRRNFVKLHEVGHGVLPWQVKVHDVIDDDDDSLSPYVVDEFEAEANYFASVTLFQHEAFLSELKKLNLNMEASLHLAKRFGGSIHATLRRYIQCSPKRCALLVLEKASSGTSILNCSKKGYFASEKFEKAFGQIDWPDEFDSTWDFATTYFLGRKGIIPGSLTLQTANGDTVFNYQFFNNSYNGFVFLYPAGEKQSSRTKIIVSESI